MKSWWPLLVIPWLGLSCGKVPLVDLGAEFTLADASWFQAEETLFAFVEVEAAQGINDLSAVEISFVTDDGEVPWTPLRGFEQVHTHVDVDCGPDAICMSASVHVPKEPRRVRMRLRYHPEGELAVDARPVFNVVRSGQPYRSRSLVVYGVFDETNTFVQWRGRHQFPTIRNQEAERLGLRRGFQITDQRMDASLRGSGENIYAYGAPCGIVTEALNFELVQTNERAVFNPEPIGPEHSEVANVCAIATVADAKGIFTTTASARRNPEVRPAFPVLRSPVHPAKALRFFLGPCNRTISADHEAMMRQRLQMEDTPTFCTDGWQDPGFVDSLAAAFRDAVTAGLSGDQDMVLVVALERDERALPGIVEQALAQVVPAEKLEPSPRLAGALVLDSEPRSLLNPDLLANTLWCPASALGTTGASLTCVVAPVATGIDLGAIDIGVLPILPGRDAYLDFIDTFSKAQAGGVESLEYLVPEFSASARHLDLGVFGSITLLNGERISSAGTDAFSHCPQEEVSPIFVTSVGMRQLSQSGAAQVFCANLSGVVPDCDYLSLGVLPLASLPAWHSVVREASYDLGLYWEFPFLLHMNYRATAAGAVSAFGVSVPFGISGDAEGFYGAGPWLVDAFPIDAELTQCTRFCDHPSFGGSGIYKPLRDFSSGYMNTCYAPVYPKPGDSGFPRDP